MDQPQLGPSGTSGRGLGCLGSIVGALVVAAVVVAVATVGLVVLAVVAAVVAVGMIAFAVDRLLLAVSPKRRKRREDLMRSWGLGGLGGLGRTGDTGHVGGPADGGQVIDTTATVETQEPPLRPEGTNDGDG